MNEEEIKERLKKVLCLLAKDGYMVREVGDEVANLQEELRRLSRLETPLSEEALCLLAWGQGFSCL